MQKCTAAHSCTTQLYWYSCTVYTRVFEHNTDNSADFQYWYRYCTEVHMRTVQLYSVLVYRVHALLVQYGTVPVLNTQY